MKASKFFLLILFSIEIAFAYQTSKTKQLSQIKWPTTSRRVDVYFNPSNSYGVSESALQTIALDSASQWNGIGDVSLNLGTTLGKDQDGLNEIYFTSDSSVFNSSNSAVAALTLVSFQDSDGKILEADVKINENNLIDTNSTSAMYIGHILTHELGHLLGLDHSQAIGSTMFWSLSLGQSKISPDDRAGLYSIYQNENSSLGSITGKVIGSSNQYGVFGVEVQAISQTSGKIMGTITSETDGSFSIKGLPKGDKYFIYTRPSVISKLSSHFSKAKNNFCENGQSFRGSFFQACGGGNIGYPQAISLNNTAVDIGKITIRCSLDVPSEYLQKKTNNDSSFNVISEIASGVGNSYVGFFSNQSMQSNTAIDNVKIDLSGISSSYWTSLESSDLFLNINVLNQTLYSPYQLDLKVTKNGTIYTASKYILNVDGWYDINPNIYIPIDKDMISNNVFNINLKANKMSATETPDGLPVSIAYTLPDYSEFADSLYFYLLNSQIVKRNNDGTYSTVSSKSYVASDNSSCTDAANTYQLTSYTVSGNSSDDSRKKTPITCGSIDTNSNGKNGPFGMIVGFSLGFLFILCIKRLRFI